MRIAAKGMPRRHGTNCIYPAGNKQLLRIPDFSKFRVQCGKNFVELVIGWALWFAFCWQRLGESQQRFCVCVTPPHGGNKADFVCSFHSEV